MKQLITFLFLLLLSVANPALAFVPFAPKADVPANPSNDPTLTLIISFIKKAAILEADEIGLPSYPDAKVVQTEESHGMTLPMICIVTPDELAAVVAFYREKFSNWQLDNFQGETLLWRVGAKEDALQGKATTIRISKAGLFQKIYGTKTEIRLWYNP